MATGLNIKGTMGGKWKYSRITFQVPICATGSMGVTLPEMRKAVQRQVAGELHFQDYLRCLFDYVSSPKRMAKVMLPTLRIINI